MIPGRILSHCTPSWPPSIQKSSFPSLWACQQCWWECSAGWKHDAVENADKVRNTACPNRHVVGNLADTFPAQDAESNYILSPLAQQAIAMTSLGQPLPHWPCPIALSPAYHMPFATHAQPYLRQPDWHITLPQYNWQGNTGYPPGPGFSYETPYHIPRLPM
jgi:hypothetical protein